MSCECSYVATCQLNIAMLILVQKSHWFSYTRRKLTYTYVVNTDMFIKQQYVAM